jgi:dynein heavy chain
VSACEQYPAQVCRMGLLYLWSRECQQAVIDLRVDRKALVAASRRFMAYTSRLPTLLNKGNWKLVDVSLQPALRARAENMITVSSC